MLSFRPLSDEDIPRVEVVQKACYDSPWDSSVIAEIIDDSPNIHGRVLELNQQVVGAVLFQKCDDHILLIDFCIDPEWQRHKLGSYMMQKMKGMLKIDVRHRMVSILNEQNLKGLNFFKSQGFLAEPYLVKELYEDGDGIKMVYNLNEEKS